MIPLFLTLRMTTTQVVETSVTVSNNSAIQDYVHPDDDAHATYEMTPGVATRDCEFFPVLYFFMFCVA